MNGGNSHHIAIRITEPIIVILRGIYYQKIIRADSCFTNESARIASQTICESIFRLKPLLDSPEHMLDENPADESCTPRPDVLVEKASRFAAANCFTEPFLVERSVLYIT
jgi:hypothetical protein